MALTNHILVRLAGVLVGLDKFDDYLVLGDDIVIANRKVANKYIELIEGLGVGISGPKRVVPVEGHPQGAEFASQFICDDMNLTPLPFGNILEGSVERLFSTWDTLLERSDSKGCNLDMMHGPDFGQSVFPLSKGRRTYDELSRI